MNEWVYAGYPNSGAYANAIVNGDVSPQQIAMNEYFSSDEGKMAGIMNKMNEEYRDYDNAWSAEQAAIQRNWSAEEAEKNRYFNMVEAAKNRDWQEYMSNTAHQREIQDLKAAGLNPILSAMGGNGAAVTSGATAAGVGNPSGSSANGNQSIGMALASMFSTMLSAQERMSETLINAQLAREENEKTRLLNQYLSELGYDVSLANAKTSAGAVYGAASLAAMASMYGSDTQYKTGEENRKLTEKENSLDRKVEREKIDAQRYGYELQYDVGMKNAGVYQQIADISRMSAQGQINYYAGLLQNMGFDRANAVKVAEIYAGATKDAAKTHAASNDAATAIKALLGIAYSSGLMNGGSLPIGFGAW